MTVLDALIQSLSRACEHNRDDQVPPAVILCCHQEAQKAQREEERKSFLCLLCLFAAIPFL
jgi:hypothetical protein